MVEVTLDNGVTGIGEGYMAVFAPKVFESIVDLTKPYLLGKDGFEIAARVRDLCSVCDYVPAYELFGGAKSESIQLYGSGGCCDAKEQFMTELALLERLGIELYKIRAIKTDIHRTAWILEEAGRRGIKVGIDMCQNLADPPQAVDDVVQYVDNVRAISAQPILFLEEAIGPDSPEGFKELSDKR